jgi:signal transduction histidine kinase
LYGYLREVAAKAPFSVEVEGPERSPNLSPEAELAAYRIVQEAVTNATRHASPNRVRITMTSGVDDFRIVVEDDGKGFHAEGLPRSRREEIGLFGMVERGEYAGGKVRIWSTPGEGTLVTLRFPTLPPGSEASKETGAEREAHEFGAMIES